MSKLDDFVTEEQFTEDAASRTKKILEVVAGPDIDKGVLERARARTASEEEMAKVVAGMFAGQAALFQALHTNIASLSRNNLLDKQTGEMLLNTIKVMNQAVLSGIAAAGGTAVSAEIIPFPGSQKVH